MWLQSECESFATNHGIGRLHKAANSVLQPIRAHSRKDRERKATAGKLAGKVY